MHRITLKQDHIAVEIAEFHEVRAINRLTRCGRADVTLLKRYLVNGKLSRQEDVAHRRATAVGDDVVVGVADVQVPPPLCRINHLIISAEGRRAEGLSTRPMEGAIVVLRLVHLGDKAHEGIQPRVIQFDERLVHQPRSLDEPASEWFNPLSKVNS